MQIDYFLSYIDPGTGSMLLTVILGVVTAAVFVVRGLFLKFKVRLQGGKIEEDKSKMPFVIFSDHKRYWNIFERICDGFEERGLECHYMTASCDDPALSKEYKFVKCEFIGEGNKCFARLNMMKAYICLSTTPGLDVLQWKRSKDVSFYVHIYHSIDDSRIYRMFALDYYDSVLTTGKIQIPTLRKLEEMRNTPVKEIEIAGCTYMDLLYERAKGLVKKENSVRTVLLAPSWGESAILSRFGENIINALAATGYKIIIRPHPQSKISESDMLDSLQKKFPESDMLQWNYDNDNFKVLSEADILISDFSGVMFDYAFIFGRPFIYADTSFDKAPYEAAWFDDEPWVFRVLPKLGNKLEEKDFGNIKQIIDQTIASKEFKKNIEILKDEAWMHRGESAKRTVDYLVSKYDELKSKEKEDRTQSDEKGKGKKKQRKKAKRSEIKV